MNISIGIDGSIANMKYSARNSSGNKSTINGRNNHRRPYGTQSSIVLISVTLLAYAPTASAATPLAWTLPTLGSAPARDLVAWPANHVTGLSAGPHPPLFLHVQLQQTPPGFTVQDVKGDPGTPLALAISIPPEIARSGQPVRERSFVMLRGLPDELNVSAGFRTRNNWVVSLSDCQKLHMNSPENYRGVFVLEVILYWGEHVPPQTRRMVVDIRPAAARTADAAQAAMPAAALSRSASPVVDQSSITGKAGPKPAPVVRRINEAEESALLRRAQELMERGNIAAARLLYEDLALRGSARGAYAMGRSFDPDVLKTIVVMGLTPDVEQAKHWYRRAVELGSRNAEERLIALNNP